ncbi:acetyl-CoA carboxylase biotin carboxyl carrier protein [Micromonospora sp. NPDC049497]|uniref:acetyl-CoA carboxylase biotin carboxyl carrier protein n=1 Tax=Micromonospora sp. NPDC049497 TaxID=3364273 RepID=UPI00379D218C
MSARTDTAPAGNGATPSGGGQPVPPRPPRVPAAGDAGEPPDAVLAGLRRHARQVVAELPGPVRRVLLRAGDSVLEVEWHDAATPGSAYPAPPPVVPPAPAVAPEPVHRLAVRSPIVGTFYRAPEPGAAPFVAVGDVIRPGQVVGIVEAMKLMNEVTADRAGRVVEVLADDGQPVEYDQPLLALDPA